MMRPRGEYVRRVSACWTILSLAILGGQAQSLKSFQDPHTTVIFSYPAEWSDGPEVLFYLGSAITTLTKDGGPAAPRAKVGFVVDKKSGPYAGTNLNGVQFVYNEVPDADADSCRKRVTDRTEDEFKVEPVQLNGVTYTHYSGGDAGLGHGAQREIYATYREGRCILFEESIHRFNLAPDEAKQLSAEQTEQLRRELDAVMRSVRLE
jgi:hypothetical protein